MEVFRSHLQHWFKVGFVYIYACKKDLGGITERDALGVRPEAVNYVDDERNFGQGYVYLCTILLDPRMTFSELKPKLIQKSTTKFLRLGDQVLQEQGCVDFVFAMFLFAFRRRPVPRRVCFLQN